MNPDGLDEGEIIEIFTCCWSFMNLVKKLELNELNWVNWVISIYGCRVTYSSHWLLAINAMDSEFSVWLKLQFLAHLPVWGLYCWCLQEFGKNLVRVNNLICLILDLNLISLFIWGDFPCLYLSVDLVEHTCQGWWQWWFTIDKYFQRTMVWWRQCSHFAIRE